MPHWFLTGEKGVGKSTLIRKWTAGLEPVGGFITLRTDAVTPGRFAVHLLDVSRQEAPSPENRLFFCRERLSGEGVRRFSALGCAALQNAAQARLILMDELGPHEEPAAGFQAAVLEALDGEMPVLGVVQQADSPFLDRVRNHPRVRLLTVTLENRDTLPSPLLMK